MISQTRQTSFNISRDMVIHLILRGSFIFSFSRVVSRGAQTDDAVSTLIDSCVSLASSHNNIKSSNTL